MAEKHENVLTSLGSKFTKELEGIVQQVLTNQGVKKDSDLADSVEWVYGRESLTMYVNDYYRAASEGRKPQARKIPIYAIINWIKKNKITSTKYPPGRLAFVIQSSIYRNGIVGKHFLEHVEDAVLDEVEIRVSDQLEELVTDSLFTTFQIK